MTFAPEDHALGLRDFVLDEMGLSKRRRLGRACQGHGPPVVGHINFTLNPSHP